MSKDDNKQSIVFLWVVCLFLGGCKFFGLSKEIEVVLSGEDLPVLEVNHTCRTDLKPLIGSTSVNNDERNAYEMAVAYCQINLKKLDKVLSDSHECKRPNDDQITEINSYVAVINSGKIKDFKPDSYRCLPIPNMK